MRFPNGIFISILKDFRYVNFHLWFMSKIVILEEPWLSEIFCKIEGMSEILFGRFTFIDDMQ